MQKRAFLIHGWSGHIENGIFPWLKENLEKRGFVVYAPKMPDPGNPKINTWVPFLSEQIGVPNENTFLFGHSMGVQAILRYLESISSGSKIGGAVFLAGFTHLTDEAYEEEEDQEIAKPWLGTPINWNKVKSSVGKFIAIFSDNDPFVPLSDSDIFKENLGAKIIIENRKGHFSDSDGIKELPSALSSVLEVAE